MTRVEFSRLSDRYPPARELVTVEEDGSFRGWRSVAPVVGRFGGVVDDPAGFRLVAQRAAEAEPPDRGDFPSDATVETFRVGSRTLRLGEHDRPDGPWGELAARVRSLVDAMVDRPVAALGISLPAPSRVRLEHRGSDTLGLELGNAAVMVKRMRGGVPSREYGYAELGGDAQEIGPGWSLDVELDPPATETGDRYEASAELVADDGGVLIPVVVYLITDPL